MRWIYLSPHLDDAALSAGGLIHDQTHLGIPVEIWTFMCGYPPEDTPSPFAQLLHKQWGFVSAEEAIRMRRAEDEKAAGILGAKAVHFDFLDCIYRRGINGKWLYSGISFAPQADDAGLPQKIADAISLRLLPDDVLVCQLSVGSHVDHVLVRQAAELLGRPLFYDIDVPYIFYKSEELEPKSAGMKEETHRITEAGLESWKEAVLAYASQISALGDAFDTPEKAEESIQSYWEEWKGVRLLQVD
jgi:LmbE family N-acetylglucosaminyl deacetylase